MAEEVTKTYWAKFGLDASNFIGGISAAQKEFLAFTAGVTASVAVFTLAFNEYSRLVEKYGQMANELQDLSYATGVSTEEIQRFHYAATLSGDSIGMVDALLGKLTLSMGQFADKTSPAAKAFHTLGVDPTGKSTSQVFEEIAYAMNNIPNAGIRASIAIDLLGRGYRDSLPYMKEYLENQEKIKSAMTFSEADQANAARAREGWASFWYSIDVLQGKTLFGAPEASKERVDSISQYYRNLGYDEDQIKKAIVSNYGLDALQKLGYYTDESGKDTNSSRINFEDTFQYLDETGLTLRKLNDDLRDYKTAMEAARQAGDQVAFEKAAQGARATQIAIDDLSETTKKYTTEQIRDANIEIRKINNSMPDLIENLNKARATGLKKDIEDANIALEVAKNRLTDLNNITGGTSATGGSSYNELFKSSLDTGGVGPDTAGFSDLANMSRAELEKIAAGGLGKSKAMAEKAQAYLSRMGAGGSAGGVASPTATKDPKIEALETLTSVTEKEYQKQTDAFQKHLDALVQLREKQYPILETLDLVHFATFEETARVGQQKVLDNIFRLVNEAGTHPIVQNFIVMGKNGPDWTPPTFTPITAPTLESADFTQVGAAVQAIVAKGLGDGTSGSKAAQASSQKIEVIVKDKTSGGVKAQLASVNGGIGGRS